MSAEAAAVLVVDATNYLFRSYYAIRDMRTRDGRPTNAVYGLANSLIALRDSHPGAAVACVMDAPGKTFRHKLHPEYKATRRKTDQELLDQVEPAKDLIRAMGMPLYCVEGVEADDVVATLALQASGAGREALVASSDKDLMYLAGRGCGIINPKDNSRMDAEAVKAKFGVPPERMLDYLTLVGDASDNVPGVPGVGAKTAAKLIAEHGGLEGVIKASDGIKGKLGERLRGSVEQIHKSAELIRLREDVDVSPAAAELGPPEPDGAAVAGICERFRFNQALRDRMSRAAPGDGAAEDPSAGMAVEVLLDGKSVEAARSFISGNLRIGLHVETEGADAPSVRLASATLAVGGRCLHLPLADPPEGSEDRPADSKALAAFLLEVLGDKGLEVCVFSSKPVIHALAKMGAGAGCSLEDVSLLAYCHDSSAHGSLEATARRFLAAPVPDRAKALDGAKSLSELGHERAGAVAGAWAAAALELRRAVGRDMTKSSTKLYRKVELPVVPVLAEMERNGILIDVKGLGVLGEELQGRMEELEGRIAEEAGGEEVNLNSPQQLAELLYDRMGFSAGRKTRGGARSTREAELERLAASADSEVPGLILAYRHAAKLVGTYTEALPRAVNPETGRLHTTFIQAGAVTGRLASVDPNLQNIPSRTPDGQRIRRCFVARDGWALVSADYSQIELRILAHFSKDETLTEAFVRGEDIHRRTASELYGVPPGEVTDEQRSFAKTINFGLIYGMGAFGLAQRLRIPRSDAAELIESYFARLPVVSEYLESVKEQAKADRYVTTFFGRRIGIEPRAAGAAARGGAMRAAINAPMQGTAADIMKLAMPAVSSELAKRKMESKMLLQVHDELVLEAPRGEVDELREALPPVMAKVAEGLDVPMEVEVGFGENWERAH